ncbi:MAG: sugar-binding domain-containing protein [Verrucomicrobiota bacterium]
MKILISFTAFLTLFVGSSVADEPNWRFTLDDPGKGWQKPDFDDSFWKEAPGGFGTRNTPGVKVKTEWTTKNIWLRQTLEFEKPPGNPTLLVFHDEDATIYLNGTLVADLKGYVTNYKPVRIAGAKVNEGKNILAVHCRQTGGGQGIDVRLGSSDEIASILAGDTPLPKVTMRSPWAEKVTAENVWQEYPRPQLRRDNWLNLNGHWDYAITPQKPISPPEEWDEKILVPFAVEAPLSGVERRFLPSDALWYRRSFDIAKKEDKRYLLNFEAVDYASVVWVNGKKVGENVGGNLPFSFDVTEALKVVSNEVILRVTDATDSAYQLHGKQRLNPKGIWYTPVSGIWQTVWMEEVPAQNTISKVHFETQNSGEVVLWVSFDGGEDAMPSAEISFEGKNVVEAKASQDDLQPPFEGFDGTPLVAKIENPKLWTPDSPSLYDVVINVGEDTVETYFAFRELNSEKDADGHRRLTLNGEEIFHWGTLDQGWWPDGLLTPPSDEAMVYDVQFLKDAGFNTIRKHIKVEPRRYYYHCDKIGMMVWQDQVSSGTGNQRGVNEVSPPWTRLLPDPVDSIWPDEAHEQFVAEYKLMVETLGNHPSIVQWVPFNEAWGQHRTMVVGEMAVELDFTRAINIASGGNFFPIGDIVDAHKYPHPEFPFDQSGGRFEDFVKVMGEFGGHGFPVEGHLWSKQTRNWGYGGIPKDKAEWLDRYRTSIKMLADLKKEGIAGGIYTQTTDVEGEINGLLTYDRKVQKIAPAKLKEISRQLFE